MNITGTMKGIHAGDDRSATGSFTISAASKYLLQTGDGWGVYNPTFSFNASNSWTGESSNCNKKLIMLKYGAWK